MSIVSKDSMLRNYRKLIFPWSPRIDAYRKHGAASKKRERRKGEGRSTKCRRDVVKKRNIEMEGYQYLSSRDDLRCVVKRDRAERSEEQDR